VELFITTQEIVTKHWKLEVDAPLGAQGAFAGLLIEKSVREAAKSGELLMHLNAEINLETESPAVTEITSVVNDEGRRIFPRAVNRPRKADSQQTVPKNSPLVTPFDPQKGPDEDEILLSVPDLPEESA